MPNRVLSPFQRLSSADPRLRTAIDAFAIDHLVVAAADLGAGAAQVRAALGCAVVPGGQHATMGTHNRLLSLAPPDEPGAYLEVLAVDPSLPAPRHPRWFGLDAPAVRERIAKTPALIAWVVRVDGAGDALDALHDAFPSWIGAPQAFSRGDLHWRMALPVPADASDTRRFDGVLPAFIQWASGEHPVMRLPASHARLVHLRAVHPQAEAVHAALGALGVAGLIDIASGDVPSLSARIAIGTNEGILA